MKVRHHDPRAGTLAVVRALRPDATFGTLRLEDFPEGDVPALPYGLVAADGTFVRQRVTASATVRVAVWAETDAAGYDLADDLHASLLAYVGGPQVVSFRPMTGPLPTTDPDTGRPMTFFTVRARLRPRTD
ncbi:hypothetical protein DER29_0478 [Micromonospora sp. M71_S20]|uniref:hypothetical protein n=1 Tax=Micromonospora sp. M71_S20 TaxID=592872 RepID=UPI000EAFDB63|nr:hypothetical protein [Micromonospora sp. M71_S20]RLK22640.1 hypothetical protein DER29_0478 [Micromonospora sp. M71_S20]